MNMAEIKKNFTYIEDLSFDKTPFIISRNNRRDTMMFLEENGSLEPILLLKIIKLLKNNSDYHNIIQSIMNDPIKTITIKDIQHELEIINKMGFK